jgi:uncharacterized protein YdhG (YjbR/CyaY superfamily)
MKKTSKYNSVQEYFNAQSAETLETLIALRNIIQKTFPDCKELLNYNIPAYALKKGGKRDKQIMIAGYKTFASLYVGNNILGHFKYELKDYTVGKASVQFANGKPLPKELIVRIIRRKNQMDINSNRINKAG